jgi:hypothetical protein
VSIVAFVAAALAPFCAGGDGCKRCEHLGMLPCGAHDEADREAEARVLFCSFVADCEACRGTLWVDCARCEGGPKQAEALERRAAIEAWLVPNLLESHLGHNVPRVETIHFELIVECDALPQGREKVAPHDLAHHIADDVEHVAGRIAEHYRIQAGDYGAKMRAWLWKELAAHQKAMERFMGTVSSGDFKFLGRDPVLSAWTEPERFDDVQRVRSLFAHNAAHMLISNAIEPVWIGDGGGGWLDAGSGHWYEYELFGRTTNYCIEEATLATSWEGGVWRAPIRRRLAEVEEPFLPGLLQKNTGGMSQAEHALCWSFYEFLLARHGECLRALLVDLKRAERPARELIAQHLGMDVLAAEAAWRGWVEEVYPLKGDELRGGARGGGEKKK